MENYFENAVINIKDMEDFCFKNNINFQTFNKHNYWVFRKGETAEIEWFPKYQKILVQNDFENVISAYTITQVKNVLRFFFL